MTKTKLTLGLIAMLPVAAHATVGPLGDPAVAKIKIYGSKKSLTVAGSTFSSRFGLKSRLFTT